MRSPSMYRPRPPRDRIAALLLGIAFLGSSTSGAFGLRACPHHAAVAGEHAAAGTVEAAWSRGDGPDARHAHHRATEHPSEHASRAASVEHGAGVVAGAFDGPHHESDAPCNCLERCDVTSSGAHPVFRSRLAATAPPVGVAGERPEPSAPCVPASSYILPYATAPPPTSR